MRKVFVSLLVSVLFSMPNITFAENTWTKKDTIYQATFLTVKAIDWLQTKEIARNPRYYEENPILGKHPKQNTVDIYFLSTAMAHSIIAYYLPEKYRRAWQCIFIGIQAGCVMNNYHTGVRFNF